MIINIKEKTSVLIGKDNLKFIKLVTAKNDDFSFSAEVRGYIEVLKSRYPDEWNEILKELDYNNTNKKHK